MPTIQTDRLTIKPSHKNCWSIHDHLNDQLIGKLFFRNQWFNILLKPQSLRLGIASEASYGLMKAINSDTYNAKTDVPNAQQFLRQMGFKQHENHFQVQVENLTKPNVFAQLNNELGINTEQIKLKQQLTAAQLVDSDVDCFGRPSKLHPEANQSWQKMKQKALADGIDLLMISSFRSLQYQANLIKNKLTQGQKLADILRTNAPPGYSEHHTGCAIDIGAANYQPLDEQFENSEAFAWLTENAHEFGFVMTYAQGNDQGIIYEPWHWCYHPKS